MSNADPQQEIRETVREGYARIAEGQGGCGCGPTSCCGADPTLEANQLAQAVGYGEEDLAALPEGANMGLSCGNPVALALLRPGEVIVDLGSGGGFDVFIAGRRVGAEGRAIGVDMTPEMLGKARRNTSVYRERTGLDNVEFRLGEIEHLPLADDSVDAMTQWQDPLYAQLAAFLPEGAKASDYVTSLSATAVKPGGRGCGSRCG